VSADDELPMIATIQQITNADKQLVLATHTPFHEIAHERSAPLLDEYGRPAQWLRFEEAMTDLPREQRATAWNNALINMQLAKSQSQSIQK
jgi:hypothetical protein